MEVARLLVESGADVNKANEDGRTPLFAASLNVNVEMARVLVEGGADMNKAASDEWTPLCAASWNGHVDVARVPLDTEMRKEVMIGLSKAIAIDRI